MEFTRNGDCKGCPLWEDATTVCVKTRLHTARPDEKQGQTQALLILGESPGHAEDLQGAPFIGPSGDYLTEIYINAGDQARYADVYVGNAVRCKSSDAPSRKSIAACKKYTDVDITLLRKHYDKVTVLGVGRTASLSLNGVGLEESIKTRQGTEVAKDVPAYWTYHPAALFPGRNPALIEPVTDHLDMVRRALAGESIHSELPTIEVNAPIGKWTPPVIALDIETYGILAGKDQNHFHPALSSQLDKVPTHRLIVLVTLAWRDEKNALHTSAYVWRKTEHLKRLREWLHRIAKARSIITGMNLQFDLTYLRFCDRLMRRSLRSDGPVLTDLAVLSHMDCEVRPERGLKPLGSLLGGVRYDAEVVLPRQRGKIKQYKNDMDGDLWRYGCTDAVNSLLFRETLLKAIGKRWTKYTEDWFSECNWTLIHFNESGVSYDRETLAALREEANLQLEQIQKDNDGVPLWGKGSMKYLQQLHRQHLQSIPAELSHLVEWTKTGEISTSRFNRQLMLVGAPDDGEILTVQKVRELLKLRDGFLTPRLKLLESSAVVYPSIYMVPGSFSGVGGKEEEGGQKNLRWSWKNPTLQNDPIEIRGAIKSRYKRGVVLWGDLNQIEMRTGALQSNDPKMLEEYRTKVDRHTQTTQLIFGAVDAEKRQVGKRINFLAMYRGKDYQCMKTLLLETGEFHSQEKCAGYLEVVYGRYQTLWEWQERLIKEAVEGGRVVCPLTNVSRTFVGTEKVIRETYENMIVNFPTQYMAAAIFQSAQNAFRKVIEERGWETKVRMCLNVHDSVCIDAHPLYARRARGAFDEVMKAVPLFVDYCAYLGRTIPLVLDWKVA